MLSVLVRWRVVGCEAGSRGATLCKDFSILTCAFGEQSVGCATAASCEGVSTALRKAGGRPGFGNQRPRALTSRVSSPSWWRQLLDLSAHPRSCQGWPASLMKPNAGHGYPRESAPLSSSPCSHQDISTLLPSCHWYKNQPQTSHSGLWPKHLSRHPSGFLKTQSWAYSQSVPGHFHATLPWWPQLWAFLAPSIRAASCGYHTTSLPEEVKSHVVDLRSDTVTQPSPEMRQAMAHAKVGDDDYGEDPTVNELQKVVADLLGMEAALFVPSATMANLIAVMCHCRRRGAQLLLGKASHLHVFEHGGVAQVGGVHSETLNDLPDGTINLDELECKIQQAYQSRYFPRPELICLENTHCSAGGRVLPLRYLQEVHQLAQQYGLRVHLDGARILNAAVALQVKPTLISQHCDSVTLCLSKGVGAPAGALLAGPKEFTDEAWRVRKLLGGGMRQAGVLAVAALIGLHHAEDTLKKDHNNAKDFAQGVYSLGSSLCSANPAAVETNIVMVTILAPWLTSVKLCELMETVSAEEIVATGQAVSVRLFPWGERCLRFVWNCDVSSDDTQLAGNKLRFVLDKCKQEQPST